MEIENLLSGKSVTEMFNFRSPSFKKVGVQRDKLSSANLIDLMLMEPRLIRRPIVKLGTKVYFGADVKVLADLLSSGELI